MEIRVKDFLGFDYFKNLRILAGEDGLDNVVTGCGVLDYELDRSLNEKYVHTNFLPGQLVLTSALFAKDNPFLLRDAVKYLVSRKCSGLVVKNVFHLPFHDSVLRYADSKSFPILLADASQIFFEDFIIQIDRSIEVMKSSELAEASLNRLMFHPMEPADRKITARRLFPFFRDQYAVAYFRTDRTLPDNDLLNLNNLQKSMVSSDVSIEFLRFEKGFFLFISQNLLNPDTISGYIEKVLDLFPDSFIGVSDAHFRVESTGKALQEALYASQIHSMNCIVNDASENPPYQRFADIGIYKVLLSMRDSEILHEYTTEILEPVIEFDAENRGSLLNTLLDYVRFGGNLKALARHTYQHENTLRYRLDKIAAITGKNYRKPAEYEELALAARTYMMMNS